MLHCPLGSDRVTVKITGFKHVKIRNDCQLYNPGSIDKSMQLSAKGQQSDISLIEPPELRNGDGKFDSKVDVYSAGVVIFQLASLESKIERFSDHKLIRPSTIDDDQLWDFLVHILDYDRKTRFLAEEALQHQYFNLANAVRDLSEEAGKLAEKALLDKQNGDETITQYDLDSTF
ncbi:MAG: hypothetical protein EZS28_050555, partial [Streblomastix strix]